MELHLVEDWLRENLHKAFACLDDWGFRRRRFRATAHEHEIWRYDAAQERAVRLTLERQWGYKYLFVLLLERGFQSDGGVRLCYFDDWLKQRG